MALSKGSGVQQCVSNISGYLKAFDSKELTECFSAVGNMLSTIAGSLDSLATFPEGDYSISSQCRDVVFQVRQVLASVLEETAELGSFRRDAVDALWCLRSEFDFRNMDIETFLKENKLEQYKSLFEKEELADAEELLDKGSINIDSLQGSMKPAPFKRLKNKLSKVESVRRFLNDEMEAKLKKAGDDCEATSNKVVTKLNKTLDDLKLVSIRLVKSIEDGKKRAELRKLVFTTVKFAAALLMTYGVAGMASAAMKGTAAFAEVAVSRGVMAVGGLQLHTVSKDVIQSADQDLEDIKALMDNIKSETSTWQGNVQQTIMNWNMLIQQFHRLLKMTGKGGTQLKETELHDLKSHLNEAKKFLDTFEKEIDELEEGIKMAVRS